MPATSRAQLCRISTLTLLLVTAVGGCRSPYYADRGALFGGLTGAGVGAAIGDASGNAGAGAVIGSAIGAITGEAVGAGIDADLARSQAEIQARMGRQMAGAVSTEDVVALTQAGLSEQVIATHIRANGVARPLGASDLINLRNQGVADSVINTMQQTPPRGAQPAVAYGPGPPQPMIVERVYQPWPWFGPPPPPRVGFGYRHYGGRRHGSSWGFSIWP